MWKVRTSVDDRPGVLAEIARACGEAEVNILGMQVFPGPLHVTDEFVVEAPDGWTDLDVAGLFETAGGTDVVVIRDDGDSEPDAATRYLNGVHEVLEDGRSVEEVLRDLLETDPPDVADYTGHDVLDLIRRNGTTVRIMRAVPFTAQEKARAQALLSLVGDSGGDQPLISPSLLSRPLPMVRVATLADLENVAAMHGRCSARTLYARYQTPLRLPMATRLARRLVLPDGGSALVAQSGLDVVGHAVIEPVDGMWSCQLIVEDDWQGRGIGSMLVKHGASRAKAAGATHLTFITVGSNDKLLKAVGAAGFVARVERRDENVHITVPLAAVAVIAAG